MKRELKVLGRLTATLSTGLFALVAIRRVLIDLQDILGIEVRIEKKQKKLASKTSTQPQSLNELTKPLQPGGLALGVVSQSVKWSALRGKPAILQASARERNPHSVVFGLPGTEKSAFLANLIQQDINNNDRAVVVIDSDGELVETIINWIASQKEREKLAARTIVLDFKSPLCNLGLNPTIIGEGETAMTKAAAVVAAFRSVPDLPGSHGLWNAQSANILRNYLALLIANNKPITELQKVMLDNDYRDELLAPVKARKGDPAETVMLDAFDQYRRLMRTDQWSVWIEPILNRIGPVMGDKRLTAILTRATNNINFEDIVTSKKVFLVKFDSRTDGRLLSGLILESLMSAATSTDEATAFETTSVYVDELDAIMSTPTYSMLTAETSQSRLGITGVIRSANNLSADFRELLMVSVGRIMSFAVSHKDAILLGPTIFKDSDELESNDSREFKQSVYEQLSNPEPNEFYCCSPARPGALKIQTNKFEAIDAAKVDKDLLQRIVSNKAWESNQSAS